MILNSPYISGSLTVTGNTNLMGALTLTGSLFGTSSQATSASYAQTSSFANAFTVGGTLTAQTLVVQTVTSSIVYSSGSNIFGNSTANTQTMTGSVNITGSLNVVGNVTSNLGFTATGSYNLLQSNGGNLSINSSGQIGNTSTGTHITISPNTNNTTLSQIVTTNNGLNVTPGGNSTTYALSITSGSYPAAKLLTVGSNILTVTGSTVGINKDAPKAALDVSGSVLITGSLSVTGGITGSFSGSITGSLFGTASQALTASFVNPLRQTVILSGSLTVSASATALSIQGSGSSVFTIDGTVGRLFQVDDSLSGSLFSVNTTSGLPVIEAFSDNTVRIGQYGQKGLFVSQSRVGVGTETPVTNLDVSGSVRVTNGLSETGSVNISGSVTMTGSFTTSGTITAQTLVVQTITSSIEYSSGSNIFGSLLTDRQTFTGSVSITGSLTVNTTSTEFQVNNNGVVMGNLLTDSHSVTGSLSVTGSTAAFSNSQTTFNFNPQTSLLAGYNYLNFGGGSIMYRNATDIYIGSNSKYGPAGTTLANYTSIYGMGMLTMDAGTLNYQSNDTSVTAGTAYGMPIRLSIKGNGLVSINNVVASSSNYKLGVSGSGYINGSNDKGIFITDNATYASIVGLNSAIAAYNPLELRASGTDYQLYLTTTGNVGIKTNNPSYSLSVNTGWIYNYGAQNASGFRYENDASGHVLNLNANNSYAQLYTGTTTALYFGSNNILSLGINTSGHVIAITDNTYTMGASGQRWSAIWSANGTIQTSDEREKKDITNTDLGLDFVSKLRPVCYKWKVGQNIVTREPDGLDENGNEQFKIVKTPREGTRVHYGLIAQEVKQVLGDKDFGGYIHDEDTDIKGLRYDQFIAPLIKAIQELSTKLEEATTRINALESR